MSVSVGNGSYTQYRPNHEVVNVAGRLKCNIVFFMTLQLVEAL